MQRPDELFPQLAGRAWTHVDAGWDSVVFDDGEWIVRVARRPQVAERLAIETRLLPELAPALPVAVPRFELVADGAVAYRKLPGVPADARVDGAAEFLRALHGFPLERARALAVPDHVVPLDELADAVLPGLAGDERRRAEQVVAEAAALSFEAALIHADLGPEHLLCDADGRLVAVIDWGDVAIGDPALDYAWLLFGSQTPLDVDDELRRRALVYRRLAPWYEVHYGVHYEPRFLESGLAGVRARLP